LLQREGGREGGREGRREGRREGVYLPVLVRPVPVEGTELLVVADAVENDTRFVWRGGREGGMEGGREGGERRLR